MNRGAQLEHHSSLDRLYNFILFRLAESRLCKYMHLLLFVCRCTSLSSYMFTAMFKDYVGSDISGTSSCCIRRFTGRNSILAIFSTTQGTICSPESVDFERCCQSLVSVVTFVSGYRLTFVVEDLLHIDGALLTTCLQSRAIHEAR